MFSLFAAMLSQAMFKFVEKSDDPSVASREAVKEHIKKLYGGGMSQAAFDDFLEIIPHSYWVSHCRRLCPFFLMLFPAIEDSLPCLLL